MNQSRLVALLLYNFVGMAGQELKLYVAPNGNDSWSGMHAVRSKDGRDGPLATIAAARDRLRKLQPKQTARVLVRQGVYRIAQTIVFTPEDSGTAAAPRIYEAFPGERPVLSGTRLIRGPWHSLDSKIYYSDLPEARDGGWLFRQLFVNGQRAVLARYPNEGTMTATGGVASHTIQLPAGTAKPSWAKDPAAVVNVLAESLWYNELVRIRSIAEDGSRIEVSGKEAKGLIRPGNRLFVEGVREELDSPNEWYLDAAAGRLYYWPKGGGSPDKLTIAAAATDRLFDFRGDLAGPGRVQHIVLRGFELVETDATIDHVAARTNQDAVVRMMNAWHCAVENCSIRRAGGYGIWLHLDCRDNRISGNEISDTGGGGVLLTSARFSYARDVDTYNPEPGVQSFAPLENRIVGNHIHHGGLLRPYCSGVHLDSRPLSTSMAAGNWVAYNDIHDMSRNGIFLFQNQGGNILEYNHIYRVVQQTDDAGAVHLATMNPLSAPVVVHGNLIHDVGRGQEIARGIREVVEIVPKL